MKEDLFYILAQFLAVTVVLTFGQLINGGVQHKCNLLVQIICIFYFFDFVKDHAK